MEENEKADALSKIIDIDDCGISFAFFIFVNNMWGVHTIDRFANMSNSKILRFNYLFRWYLQLTWLTNVLTI